jgi:feruloyl esterase
MKNLLFTIAIISSSSVAAAAELSCEDLRGLQIPVASIGLPTTGAHVISTSVVAAGGAGVNAIGEYCKVLAAIHPVDATAPSIKFQLNLPAGWNKKALMFGGGGYNGTIRDPAGRVSAGALDKPGPLGLGYATFHGDSGHQVSGVYVGLHSFVNGAFGTNEEALKNFAGDAIKKTRDAAMHIIAKRYGSAPSKSYFAGGSTGGREALAAIQRWPEDWDGAIAIYPAPTAAMHMMQMGRITRALAAPGAFPNAAKRTMLYDAVMAACDELDGIKDGVISNVKGCKFEVATLRCPDGKEGGDSCLSDAQINALNVFNTPLVIRYPLGSRETTYPGFNVYGGADLVGPNPVAVFLALNTAPPQHPPVLNMPFHSQFWAQWVQYFVAKDPQVNALELDPEAPGKYQQRISDVAEITDVNNADLSRFAGKGGKLIMLHGQADALVSPRATADYYNRVADAMGKRRTNGFVRYYEVPGYAHVFGKAFNAGYDSLGALESWVEQGVAPVDQIVKDNNPAANGRTRPLCDYPGWPKYRGNGDVNVAANYVCAKS